MRRQSVKKFFESADLETFRVILDSVRPSNEFMGIEVPDITSWRFCDVADLMLRVESLTPVELAEFVLSRYGRVTSDRIMKADINSFIRFLKHVKTEIEKIGKLQEQLKSEPKAELVAAGIDELNRFGVASIYYSISKNPDDWDRISEIPYSKIFTKLMLDKVNAEIQERYNDILIERSKQK